MLKINADDKIYGHENVKSVLNAALTDGHVGHAYIFTGIEGVGKYTVASAFARKLVGTEHREHPDIITVTNEWGGNVSKSGVLLVDTIKEMRRDIYIRPYSGGRKVYIVPHADTMNAAAQNSLLKVFEEPPLYCTMILLAENSSLFLPTILSRATEIRFSPLPAKLVEDYLIEVMGVGSEEAVSKAVMSAGSIGRAVSLLGSSGPDELRTRVIDAVVSLAASENRVIFELAGILKAEKDSIDFIFSVLESFFGDLIHIKAGLDNAVVNIDKKNELDAMAGSVTKRAALSFLDITLKYKQVIASNANFRIAMFCMACEYWEEIHGRDYRSSL